MTNWGTADIPSQAGRIAVVTGTNSGLGFVTARELARAGATVVMTSRDATRGEAAELRLRAAVPDADVRLEALDSPRWHRSASSRRASRRPTTASTCS